MQRFARGDLSFDVRDSGPDNGTPVVLLHGFPQTSTSWLKVEPMLHASGIRTLAFDQRGYSPAARPRARRAYTVAELTDDVVALLDAVGHRTAHIVGHDWGGSVAWAMAGLHPARCRSVTVLSTPHPGAMLKAWRSTTQGLRSWYMVAFQIPVLPEIVLRGPIGEQLLTRSGLPPRAARRDADRLRQPDAATGALNWYRGLPFNRSGAGSPANVPATYVWGSKDVFLGRRAAEATADWITDRFRPDYRFVELDAGHWLPETHPDQVAQAIVERVRSERRTGEPRTGPGPRPSTG